MPSNAVKLVDRFEQLSVWVVGDLMLDEYLEGPIDRISPEAPVQVVSVAQQRATLGGAANVARGITALGARVRLGGCRGDDAAGDQLLHFCDMGRLDRRAVIVDPGRPTTRKVRVVSMHQQMIRLDWEERGGLPEDRQDEMLDALEAGPIPNAIVVSDYQKGAVQPRLVKRLVGMAKRYGIPLLVDSKSLDLEHFRGATGFTPNLAEFQAALGRRVDPSSDEALLAGAREWFRRTDAAWLLVTLGPLGMALVEPSGNIERIPASVREVYDVTGAGDTVIATLALGLAAGASPSEAAQLANRAAGIVVGKVGTSTVSPEELVATLAPTSHGGLLELPELKNRLLQWRRIGRKVVFTNGCFDLLHVGHLKLLRAAREQGDVLIVGLNSDASVRRLKGPTRPMVPETDRAELLAGLHCVDAVVLFDEDTPARLIGDIVPNVLVKGADYRVDQVVGREIVEAAGGKVVLVDLVPDRSTTQLAERLREQEVSS